MRLSFAEEMGVAETKRGYTQFGTEEDPCLDIVNDGFFKFEIAASKIHFFFNYVERARQFNWLH